MKTSRFVTSSLLLLTFLARASAAETDATPTASATTATSSQAMPSVTDPTVQAAIVAAVEQDRKRFGGNTPVPATLIGVWDDKGGSFIRALGYSDLEKKLPLTPVDHFRIGSNTKTFVISVLLQLVAEKKLTLDDPLSRFSLGVTIPNGENITVRELCNMRSGLFEGYDTPQFAQLNWKVPKDFNPRMLVGWAMKQKPYFAPGTAYHYTNTNWECEAAKPDRLEDRLTRGLRKIISYIEPDTIQPTLFAAETPEGYRKGTTKRKRLPRTG
jgi:D-alanyl-D-alanine carboxypeptidase